LPFGEAFTLPARTMKWMGSTHQKSWPVLPVGRDAELDRLRAPLVRSVLRSALALAVLGLLSAAAGAGLIWGPSEPYRANAFILPFVGDLLVCLGGALIVGAIGVALRAVRART